MRRTLAALALAVALPTSALLLPAARAETVLVKAGETLSEIAERHGVGLSRLMQANGITDADLVVVGQRLTIPGGGGGRSGSVTVAAGDTLSDIAVRLGVDLSALMGANRITDPDLVVVGQRLTVPGGAGRTAAAAPRRQPTAPYTVKSGETLSQIAVRFDTTTDRLIELNALDDPDRVLSGTRLRIPMKPGSGSDRSSREHKVQEGESLSVIAERYGTSVSRLVALNSIDDPDRLLVGSTLKLRGTPSTSSSKPAPKPKPTASAPAAAKPAPKPAAKPAAKPAPQAAVQPSPAAAKPAPRPAAQSGAKPAAPATAKPAAQATSKPAVQATAQATPTPASQAAPRPAAQATTKPTPPAAAKPAAQPAAKPTAQATPEPTVQARPKPAAATRNPSPRPRPATPRPTATTRTTTPVSRIGAATQGIKAAPTTTAATTTAATTAAATAAATTTKATTTRPVTAAAARPATGSPAPGSSGRTGGDWRPYGPLQIDWSKWQPMGGSHVAPSLNSDGKARYMAVNCKAGKLNTTTTAGQWNSWVAPEKDFEKKLVEDICQEKDTDG